MKKYNCEICGKKHDIYRSIEIEYPRIIFKMSEDDKEKRVTKLNEFLIVDKNLMFANGWINVEMKNHEFPFFFWKTWTSISIDQFKESIDKFANGEVFEFQGNLEEELLFYPDSYGLKTSTLIQATNDGFIVEIKVTEDSQLMKDQLSAISKQRMIEIMQMIHHYPNKNSKVSNKAFKQRLIEELEKIQKEYISKEEDFAINLSTNTVLFQIISNKLLEVNINKKSGYGLHLSFDESFEESLTEIANFRKMEYSKGFNYHDLDEIPTYQLDLGADKKRLIELVESILIHVYKESLKEVEIDSFGL